MLAMKTIKTAVLGTACFLFAVTLSSQEPATKLIHQMLHGPSAASAESRLESRGAADVNIRRMLSEDVPALLANTKDFPTLSLLAKLARALRLQSAVPQLCDLLKQPPEFVDLIGLSRFMELKDDPMAAALVQIGDPSVPQVSLLLQSGNRETRSRAVRVLIKIGTPLSRSALQKASSGERDPGIRGMIDGYLKD
jgi:hypothetical protein